jgi:hypothetical protein
MYLEMEANGKVISAKLPIEVAQKIRDLLAPDSWQVM